jgi:hypothetical protein
MSKVLTRNLLSDQQHLVARLSPKPREPILQARRRPFQSRSPGWKLMLPRKGVQPITKADTWFGVEDI